MSPSCEGPGRATTGAQAFQRSQTQRPIDQRRVDLGRSSDEQGLAPGQFRLYVLQTIAAGQECNITT
jgi:hypothetical protein